jgi:Leucine-rich repeat (LRR) protein
MPLVETAFVAIVAKPIANFLFKQAFGDSLLTTMSGGVLEMAVKRFTDKENQEVEKRFRKLGEEVAGKLWPLFESENARFSEGDLEAIAHEVGLTLESTLETRLLIQVNLNAARLEEELRRVRVGQIELLGADGKAVYQRALKELAPQIMALAPQLKDFQEKVSGEILAQLDTLESLLDGLLNGPAILAARYESRYLRAVQDKLDEMELFGADLRPGQKRHPLLKVAYVSLNLNQQGGSNIGAESLFDQYLKPGGRVLITGDAGSGKSTLSRWLALETVRSIFEAGREARLLEQDEKLKVGSRAANTALWRGRIPFLVRLRDYADGVLPKPNDIPATLETALDTPPGRWVEDILQDGRGLIIFDGIDEVPQEHRDRLQADMEGYFRQYEKTPFLLTARPAAVEDWDEWLKAREFQQARVNPMSPPERMLLIQRWHEAVRQARKELGDGPKELEAINGKAQALCSILAHDSRLSRLSSYPLMCAIICALHHWKGQDPLKSYWQMCEAFCKLLLDERDREAQVQLHEFPACYAALDYENKRDITQAIAVRMVQESFASVLPLEDAIEATKPILALTPGRKASEAEPVLKLLAERGGILRKRQEEEFEFAHNIFKEFLVADHLMKERRFDELEAKCAERDWREVIVAAAANSNRELATRLIRRLLEQGDHASCVLALRCWEVARYLDESLEPQLQTVADGLFPPADEEQAEAIGTLGERYVDQLAYREGLAETEANACVMALGHINTDKARAVAEGYIPDDRVSEELARVIDPFLIPRVLEALASVGWDYGGWRSQISDISGLSGRFSSPMLNLRGTSVSDLKPLQPLTQLQRLYLDNTSMSDLRPLQTLTQLQTLYLSNTSVSDLRPLQALTQLQELYLMNTSVSDLRPLQTLTQLQTLDLSNTSVSDLKPLQPLTQLQTLDLGGTSVSDLKPLQPLTQLQTLYLSGTSVSDLKPLQPLTQLQALDLDNTSVSDLRPLQPLTQLRRLYLNSTSLSDLRPLQTLTQLQSLHLSNTSLSDLRPLQTLTQLRELDLSNTSVSDLRPLQPLTQLRELYLPRAVRGQAKGVEHLRCEIYWM